MTSSDESGSVGDERKGIINLALGERSETDPKILSRTKMLKKNIWAH